MYSLPLCRISRIASLHALERIGTLPYLPYIDFTSLTYLGPLGGLTYFHIDLRPKEQSSMWQSFRGMQYDGLGKTHGQRLMMVCLDWCSALLTSGASSTPT